MNMMHARSQNGLLNWKCLSAQCAHAHIELYLTTLLINVHMDKLENDTISQNAHSDEDLNNRVNAPAEKLCYGKCATF